MLHSLSHLSWPFAEPVHVSIEQGSPELDTVFQIQSHQCIPIVHIYVFIKQNKVQTDLSRVLIKVHPKLSCIYLTQLQKSFFLYSLNCSAKLKNVAVCCFWMAHLDLHSSSKTPLFIYWRDKFLSGMNSALLTSRAVFSDTRFLALDGHRCCLYCSGKKHKS